ncbi:hypothetical protein GCM10010961_24760 [Pseudodonghicola xiamenensis]|uniref:Uncharacterized protein n=1 Tax=Pseudodonghicola xiamenensis TaxID=337702 RepID=A0A8J3MF68_9RHOB|nr:hypothetical protein GCM10010961_24760 [Pseudodonghicola xiamenensis]
MFVCLAVISGLQAARSGTSLCMAPYCPEGISPTSWSRLAIPVLLSPIAARIAISGAAARTCSHRQELVTKGVADDENIARKGSVILGCFLCAMHNLTAKSLCGKPDSALW